MTPTQIVVAAALVSLAGCSPKAVPDSGVASGDQITREFEKHVENYARLRAETGQGLLPLEPTAQPGEIDAAQKALAARIRERRTAAKQGDIFTPDVRTHFRRRLAGPLEGKREENIRSLLQEDAPAPGAVPLAVNGPYPTSQPYASTPPSFLQLLPPLPKGLEYRFLGRDLILLDQSANLIVDFMRNAIPPVGA